MVERLGEKVGVELVGARQCANLPGNRGMLASLLGWFGVGWLPLFAYLLARFVGFVSV